MLTGISGPAPHTEHRRRSVALLRMGVPVKRAAHLVGRSESFVRNAMERLSKQSTIDVLRQRLAEADAECGRLRNVMAEAADLLRRLADVTCDEDAEECLEMVAKLEATDAD